MRNPRDEHADRHRHGDAVRAGYAYADVDVDVDREEYADGNTADLDINAVDSCGRIGGHRSMDACADLDARTNLDAGTDVDTTCRITDANTQPAHLDPHAAPDGAD